MDHQLRTWSVLVGDDQYNVTDFGSACGYRVECKGNTVWTGIMGRRGQYDTHTTTLTTGKLDRVLRLVFVGDQRHAQAHGSQRTPGAPKSATRPEETKSTRRAKDEASPSSRSSAPPSSATRATGPKTSNSAHARATSPSDERAAKPKAKRQAKATTGSSHPAHASPSGAKAPEKSKAKRQSKPKTAAGSAHAGPQTQRTPVSQPSAKPSSRRASPHLDDTAVLNEIKKNLHEGDPSTAETHFQVMKAIWMRGGREAAVAWQERHKIPNVVDAFDDWMEKNVDAARALIGSAPHGAPKHEQVA